MTNFTEKFTTFGNHEIDLDKVVTIDWILDTGNNIKEVKLGFGNGYSIVFIGASLESFIALWDSFKI